MFNSFMAFFASLGFAILFSVKKEHLLYAAINGAIGGMTYYFVLNKMNNEALALFVGASIITIIADIMARILKCPTTTFLICALIPLVPGGTMYYTILSLVEGNNIAAFNYALVTIFNACAIVIGCTLISSIIKTYNKIINS